MAASTRSDGKRMPRNPVMASFWQFDPTTEEEPIEVEAMPAALTIMRTESGEEGRVLIAVRGRPGPRYETGDSVWIELEDAQALRLIGELAAALREKAAA